MTINLDEIERLAKAAGGDKWTASDGVVWFDDGDSALQVMNPVPAFIAHDNLGTWPDAIDREDVALFAAAVNPAAILALIAEVRALREDAYRYRWLREQNSDYKSAWCVENIYNWVGEDLDAEIDKARGAA
ncbi:hypothetical protein BZM27_05935 [Paraburkholderia steynii]|uniref:Ead/Ea22-like family protein n=1 Tax=Paraburkholderia steynii TaxID=1245441 RepID=A0A4R0XMF0_9BURK|nr:hypothetical protein BZM27_05935 [Paraburkholderia steynii]